jgi:hypothetical protein
VYVLAFGVLLPGEYAIYAYIAATFLVPNYATAYVGLGGLPPFFFLELVGAAAILIALARATRDPAGATSINREQWICAALVATVAGHYLVYWPLRVAGYYPVNPSISSIIVHGTEMGTSLVYLYGCTRLIVTLTQVERAAWLFVACGVELLLERVAFSTFHLWSGIGRYAFDEVGRFKSLTENDPLAVGVYSSVALLCAMYLALRRRSVLAALLVVPFWVLAFTVYQRTFAIGPLVAMGVFAWQFLSRRGRAVLLALPLCAALVATTNVDVAARVRSIYKGTWRDRGSASIGVNPFSLRQLQARLGIQARAADVFVGLFPFGTGEFVARDYLSAPLIPTYFRPAVGSDELSVNYENARAGIKRTETHNGFLEHVVAYGLLGMIGLSTFIMAIVANVRASRSDYRMERALAFAVLAFFAVFFTFYAFPKIYVAYLLFFHATFLLRRPDPMAVGSSC